MRWKLLLLASVASGRSGRAATVSPQCQQPYVSLDDHWRATTHGGTGPVGGYSGDVSNASGTTTVACRKVATGVGGGQWYRFSGSGGDALPLRSPHCLHCGTDRVGWLSAWPPWNPATGGPPPSSYAVPGVYPTAAVGVINATVCFEYCDAGHAGPCREHRVVRVVNCSAFLLWQLQWAPDCASGYCTAPSLPPPPPTPPPPHRWSGPRLEVQHTRSVSTSSAGFPSLQLEGVANPLPPFWLNLNNQGHPNTSAIVVQIVRAREAGLKLLAIQLSDGLTVPPVAPATSRIMELIKAHHPTAKLLVRWYLTGAVAGRPDWGLRLQNISNSSQTQRVLGTSSPTAAWAQLAAAEFSASLAALDAAYPGKLAGVLIEGLCGGEWFYVPTDPVRRMAGDYTEEMRAEFCAAEEGGIDIDGSIANCALPTAAERDTASLGNALLQWDSPTDPSARSFRFNRFLSQKVAGAIGAFADAVKNVSKGKALTIAFNGYLFDLSDSRLTGSGHLDLAALLANPTLDVLASPYQYGAAVRQPGGRFTSHGPVDSATLHGKMWVSEDDSRTVLTDRGAWDQHVNTTSGTVNLIRRNMYTAMLHRQGLYWLDLASVGWWGRDDNATMIAATDAMWGNASHVLTQWQALLGSPTLQASTLPPAEVAIFVDEVSAAARPLLGRGGTVSLGFQFEVTLQQQPWQDIAGIGAPVRVYLMSDLLHENFPASEIKLAIFLNAFMVGSDIRQAVKMKLQRNGRTVAWMYAPGLFDAESCGGSGGCTPDTAAASNLVGLPLLLHATDSSPLATTFEVHPGSAGPVLPASVLGSSYGAQLGSVSPWLSCVEEASELSVLGRYAGGEPSVCWADHAAANYSAVFVGTPRPPTDFWRSIAQTAGVHVYTAGLGSDDDTTGTHADAVEVGGSALLFHAGTGSLNGTTRRVYLPRKLAVRSEWGDIVCAAAAPCDSFETAELANGENVLYWLAVPPAALGPSTPKTTAV